MIKRLLAFMCVLAILTGMVVVPASAANASGEGYEVGYAKLDINPWVELEVTEDGVTRKIGIENRTYKAEEDGYGIIPVKIHDPAQVALSKAGGGVAVGEKIAYMVAIGLGGYGTASERQLMCLTDDNGDGYISYGDGIYVTCTAVTDSNGKTVLYLTLDLTGVSNNLTEALRNAIVERLNGAVTKDAIMINANHSHSGLNINQGTAGSARRAYYDYMIERVADAAEKAMADCAPATMSKGSIEASEGMDTLGYGKVEMNRVRHTVSNRWLQIKRSEDLDKDVSWSAYKPNGEHIYVPVVMTSHTGDGPVYKVYGKDETGKYNPKYTVDYNPVNKEYAYKVYYAPERADYQKHMLGSVSEVDETLYVLKFDRGDGKNPVVMINWRAHSTLNGDGSANKNLSSDYANSLRYRLENNRTLFDGDTDYCVAFWQGAAGNVNAGAHDGLWKTEESKTDDVDDEVKVVRTKTDSGDDVVLDDFYEKYYNSDALKDYDDRFFYCARYGYLLAKIAMVCMEDETKMVNCDTGEIRTKQVIYQADRQQFSDGEYDAAVAWSESTERPNQSNPNYVYPYWYDVDTNGDGDPDERYIINSKHHAKNIIDSRGKVGTISVEINAIMMGDNVAIVTLPGEAFDRYSADAELFKTEDNDWEDLIDTETYGEPFVMGYTNGRVGYIPNTLAYNYMAEQRKDLKDPDLPVNTTFDHPDNYAHLYNVYGVGSYESNNTELASGTGEKLVAKLDEMLTEIGGPTYSKRCTACNSDVTWLPLNQNTIASITDGHYYLTNDFSTVCATVITIDGGDGINKLCLDLNGQTYTNNGRIFTLNGTGELNIMDLSSGKDGAIIAKSGGKADQRPGGMMGVSGSGKLNVYGGTLKFERDEAFLEENGYTHEVEGGGVINATGTSAVISLYDGKICGGEMANSKSGNNQNGAAIRIGGRVTLNVSGGQIVSGIANPNGLGNCVYAGPEAKVNISGDGRIEELYCTSTENLTVNGPYTGVTNVEFVSSVGLQEDMSVGTVNNIDQLLNGTLNCLNDGYWFVVNDGSLCLTQDAPSIPVASIGTTTYDSLEAAVEAVQTYYPNCPESNVITLWQNVEGIVEINGTVYLDLNGHSIDSVSVAEGVALYCLDSETDDYMGPYGTIGTVTGEGTVAGVEAGMIPWDGSEYPDGSLDSYLMVEEEENKNLSFHRVTLQITDMTLSTDKGTTSVDLSYKSIFNGDDVVKDKIQSFGVALSVQEEPNATNMGTTSKYSEFTDKDNFTKIKSPSTLLKGVMKKSNADLINRDNADMRVHGRAYILTADGYVFGVNKDCTLKEVFKTADTLVGADYYDDKIDEKKLLTDMYDTYRAVMQPWNLENIVEGMREQQVKILGIGNSFTIDSMYLLGQVYKAEHSSKNVTLGIAYQSGCSLEDHYNNINDNKGAYTYYYWNGTGWQTKAGVTLRYILEQQNWDMVSMQQDSENSGWAPSYKATYINRIKNYVKQILGYKPTFMWNMTWSYPESAVGVNNKLVSYYGNSTQEMYRMITETVQKKIVPDSDFETVIPAGTAVQNLKDSRFDNDVLFRDTKHLSDLGRVIAAYAWYCSVEDETLGQSIGLEVVPGALRQKPSSEDMQIKTATQTDTVENRKAIATAVDAAIRNPYTIDDNGGNVVDPAADDELNILMVGNSFCSYYTDELYQLLAAAYPKKEVNIYNVYYDGCKLNQHLRWLEAGTAKYGFFHVSAAGRVELHEVDNHGVYTLAECVRYANWDYISLQGTVSNAPNYRECEDEVARMGLYQTIAEYAEPLLDYFHKHHPMAQLLWHCTWAFEDGRYSVSEDFTYEAADLVKYHDGMQWVCKKMEESFATDYGKEYTLTMVNTGAAWKEARDANAKLATSLIPDKGGLCARLGIKDKTSFPLYPGVNDVGDGYHDGDIGGGQFLNACVWYETITGKCCLENTYQPTMANTSANKDGNYALSDALAKLLKTAACTCGNH